LFHVHKNKVLLDGTPSLQLTYAGGNFAWV
jgi:hypothetical protein